MIPKRSVFTATAVTVLAGAVALPCAAQAGYVPPPGSWERRAPEQVGMDPAAVRAAVGFAVASESRAPRDLEEAHQRSFGREPFGEGIGPFAPRGAPTGLIIRSGYLVASWGDPEREEMTFSVAKSILSSVVGVAYDRGLIGPLDRSVAQTMGPTLALGDRLGTGRYGAERTGDSRLLHPFDGPHNSRITWDHLLRQTSDWEGALWGKPDWADRPDPDPARWTTRPRNEPGSVYEYNDTRVNVLALAALNVWRRPLPEVLREEIMDPIGASRAWRWYGYENSWVLIDGLAMQSVSGGGHWGGGLFVDAYDLARFGLLTLRDGRWGDRQLLSREWLRMARTPTPAQPDYGFMNFMLNPGRKRFPSAPESAYAHLGNGTNMVYVDPVNDLVVVARWIDNAALDGLIGRVVGAVRPAR